MNLITDKINIGTIGELLVQLRLLEYGVQAAPPLKDSGNDLIAIKGESFRAIQIKTTKKNRFNTPKLDRKYHLLAIVQLVYSGEKISLDKTPIYIITKEQVKSSTINIKDLEPYRMNAKYVEKLFSS